MMYKVKLKAQGTYDVCKYANRQKFAYMVPPGPSPCHSHMFSTTAIYSAFIKCVICILISEYCGI
jgi:hypothetical protein